MSANEAPEFDFGEELKFTNTEWLRYGEDCTTDGALDPVKLLIHLNSMVGIHHLLNLHASVHKGDVAFRYFNYIESIVSGMVDAITLASSGSIDAENKLIALNKILRPQEYNLPKSVIKNIVDRYNGSPQLARAGTLRHLMSLLTKVVRPAHSEKSFNTRSPILLLETCKDEGPLLIKAKRQWKRNSTLQSLAIRIYLSELVSAKPDTRVDERTLKRDLLALRRWEAKHIPEAGDVTYEGARVGDEILTWPAIASKEEFDSDVFP
jgi:hypothetical protein